MSLGKKDIAKNISSEAQISLKDSSILLEEFFNFLKYNKTYKIKISNFGTFSIHSSPKRLGRNPKTKEVFEISRRKKLSFKPSNKVRISLN
tara:strand:- start:4290 stop:4562 length:273 start_codon:yes stop_codon:yes gene_type:complete